MRANSLLPRAVASGIVSGLGEEAIAVTRHAASGASYGILPRAMTKHSKLESLQ